MYFYRVIQMFVGYFAVSAFLKSTSTQTDASLTLAMSINITSSDYQFFDHQSTEQKKTQNHLRGKKENSVSRQLTSSTETGLRTDYRAYYPLNGDTLDYSGNAYHGTAFGDLIVAMDRFGRQNSAYHFGGDAYISGGSGGLPTAERTISLWFNPDALHRPDGRGMNAFSYGGGGCSRGRTLIFALNCGNCGSVSETKSILDIEAGSSVSRLTATTSNPIGQWQHWVMTTRASGTSIYLNGNFIAGNGQFISDTDVLNNLFSIGSMVCGTSVPHVDSLTAQWYGYLDDVTIYNSALSDAEIKELYINQPPVLKNNQFSIIENTPFIVTSTMLSATDVSSDGSTTQQPSVQFIIKDIQNGYFELTTAPGVSVSTFTQQQIISNVVRFVPDGSQQTPTFDIKVSDGLLWTTPIAANIVFNLKQPTPAPTVFPTAAPTSLPPSRNPTTSPSQQTISSSPSPSARPVSSPTVPPITTSPPSAAPTIHPITAVKSPTAAPIISLPPSNKPTTAPSSQLTTFPSRSPSLRPVLFPTISPTPEPSSQKIPTSQNNPPKLIGNLDDLSEQHTNLNKKQIFIIPLSIFKDPENNAMTLSMETDSTGNEFSFSSKTNQLTFTPRVSGTQRFKFFATDSHDARSQFSADLSLITDTDGNKKPSELSPGEIAGITIGTSVAAALVAAFIRYCIQRLHQQYAPVGQAGANNAPVNRT